MKEQLHKKFPITFVDEILESFNKQKIGQAKACELLDISRSRLYQLRREWLRVKRRGETFLLWNRPNSNFNRLNDEVVRWLHEELKYICNEAKLFRRNFNFAFLAEQATKEFGRPFNRNTIRLFALKHGYYHGNPEEKKKIYIRFETSGPGALFQHDTSIHRWLPLTKRKQALILTKDDYSRMIVGAKLVDCESAFAHLETVRETVTTYGPPLSYYVDNHSIFRFIKHRGVHVRCKATEADSKVQFKRALSSINVGIIYAKIRQPQSKGKIEKMFDYFQRRLPVLAERYKITTVAEAKPILDDIIDFYNKRRVHMETDMIPFERWQQALEQNKSKLQNLDTNVDLNFVFSIHLERTMSKTGTISFMGKQWKVDATPKSKVTVCLIPHVKIMIFKDSVKLCDYHL